jgi:hypothetical protein
LFVKGAAPDDGVPLEPVQGCVRSPGQCAVWINGALSTYSLDGLLHELGHNFNLKVAVGDGLI